MGDKASREKAFLKAATLITVLTLLLYARSLHNQFVWDDAVVVENNDFIRSGRNFPALFSRSYLTSYRNIDSLQFYTDIGSGEASYRPVTTATYFMDYYIWKLNPFGYHLTSLLLHIFNAILVFIFAGLIVENYQIALLSGLLFALHPVNAEAVGIISFREELLGLFFYLSSLILYIKRENTPARRTKRLVYGASLVLFLLALFSKEMAVTLPLVLILYDYLFVFKQKARETIVNFKSRYLGYVLVLLFYLFTALWAIGYKSKDFVSYPGGSFFSSLLTMSKVFATYLQWLVLPFNIHVTLPDDPLLISRCLFEPAVLLSLAVFAFSLAFAVKMRKAAAVISFAILWFLITLLPVSNIFPLMNYIACRYLYIPIVGFCLLAAMAIYRMRKFVGYAAVLVLASYATFTFTRNAIWGNNVILWSEMARHYPKNALAHSNLAGSLSRAGLLDEAASEYRYALRLDPGYAQDYNGLGLCYFEKMMFDDAIREFRNALKLDPGLLAAYNNLGSALGEKGLYAEAIAYFNKAINIDNKHIPAYNGLGITYARMKKFAAAKRIWQEALKINPRSAVVKQNLEKLSRIFNEQDNK